MQIVNFCTALCLCLNPWNFSLINILISLDFSNKMDICHSISVKTRSKSTKLKTNWTKRKDCTSKNCILNIFCYVFSCINFDFLLRILSTTKMYIKSVPYWHQKSANWALIYALVLMLLPKFFPNTTIRLGAVLASIFLVMMLNLHQI